MANPINDGFMMLLDEFLFGGKPVGLVSADGLTWGGDDASIFDLKAAQQRNGPVKSLVTDPGTDQFKFQMIQLIAENMKDIMGGDINGENYSAPEIFQTLEDSFEIRTGTGQTIKGPKASMYGKVRGQLGGTNNLYVDTTVKILSQAGVSPYSIGPTVPNVTVSESEMIFAKEGGTQVARISASGAVVISGTPSGFTLAQDGNYLVVTAAANSGAAREGTLTIKLVSDNTKVATIALSQAAGS